MAEKQRRGLAVLDEETKRRIARQGELTSQRKGVAHIFTDEDRLKGGRKGGLTSSQDREHMAQIGRKGGQVVSQDRKHMSEIGRKGGSKSKRPQPSSITDETTEQPSPESKE